MGREPGGAVVEILVVCAVAQELGALRAREHVRVVPIGVGPVEAAIGAARALAQHRCDVLINAGIAGGFRDRCTIGDAVVVTRDDYAELGLEDGRAFALPPGSELVRTVEAHPRLLQPFLDGLIPAIAGRGVTSATVTSTTARALVLAHRFRADVETMEGFAVMRAAQLAGVPAVQIRGVSNYVGDRETNEWNFGAGAAAAVATTEALLDVLLSE
ncbi:MAG TPA: futalosine hydrolase [Candidatus Baltobacteraceae bacterium]|nr:futalosine hydrolase [Candidatus Baltobacteraceae bacterium]